MLISSSSLLVYNKETQQTSDLPSNLTAFISIVARKVIFTAANSLLEYKGTLKVGSMVGCVNNTLMNEWLSDSATFIKYPTNFDANPVYIDVLIDPCIG